MASRSVALISVWYPRPPACALYQASTSGVQRDVDLLLYKPPALPEDGYSCFLKRKLIPLQINYASTGTAMITVSSVRPAGRAKAPSRLAAHRARMRATGLRVLQLWVPDTSLPEFAAQCRKQSTLAAQVDREGDLMPWLDAAFNDLAGSN